MRKLGMCIFCCKLRKMYSLDLVTVCKYADARYYFDDGVKALHTFSLRNNVINNDMVSKIIKNLYGETFF